MRRFLNLPPVRFITDIADVYFSRRVGRSAAELAYFLVLSFFPILICVNAFIGALEVNISAALEALEHIIPEGTLHILTDFLIYVGENQSNGMLVAGVIGTLVSASAALRSLMAIMDDIYGTTRYQGLWGLLASVVFSVLMLATIYLSMVVVLTGNWFFRQVERWFNLTNLLTDWQWLRFVLLFALVFFFVLLLYRICAPRGKPRPPVVLGAFLATVVLVAASVLFSWFIAMFSNYSLVYGSLASVVILLTWLFLCGNVLIVGNIFNYVLHRRRTERDGVDR